MATRWPLDLRSAPPPRPSFAGSWRSASGRARSTTRRNCARCCLSAGAVARVRRPPARRPQRPRRLPRGPCSAWYRDRRGTPTGRCRCWRGSSRLSPASRGACRARAASERRARRSARPHATALRGRPGLPAPAMHPEPVGASPMPSTHHACLSPSSATPLGLRSSGLLQATWCLSPWTRGRGPGPPPRQWGRKREGRVGRTGLEEIKETQMLPGQVPLVIPQSLGSASCRRQGGSSFQGPGRAPFSISLQS